MFGNPVSSSPSRLRYSTEAPGSDEMPPPDARFLRYGGADLSQPAHQRNAEGVTMSDNYSDWHPGSIIADSARRYTEVINNKRRPTRPAPRSDEAQRRAAAQLTCPSSPAPAGTAMSHHRFGFESDVCAFCGDHPEWILNTPQMETTP